MVLIGIYILQHVSARVLYNISFIRRSAVHSYLVDTLFIIGEILSPGWLVIPFDVIFLNVVDSG